MTGAMGRTPRTDMVDIVPSDSFEVDFYCLGIMREACRDKRQPL